MRAFSRSLLLLALVAWSVQVGTCTGSIVTTRRAFLRGAAAATVATASAAAQSKSASALEPSAAASAAAPAAGGKQTLALGEGISGIASGVVVSTAKLFVLHPIDTVKTRLQTGSSRAELFANLYSGIGPPFLISAPSGAIFFGVKDFTQSWVKSQLGSEYAQLATLAGVFLAQFPYWAVRTPAEVLKTRSQANADAGNMVEATRKTIEQDGVCGLYEGYGANVAYAFPADATKFLVYEQLKTIAKRRKGGQLSPLEAAVLGSMASAAAQAVTTPLDVVRTRIMVQDTKQKVYKSVTGGLQKIWAEEGFKTLWVGTVPRVGRSLLSGAIQFSSYEFTKALFPSSK